MNILSLCDGISCGQIALNKIGIKYDNYYASEIDNYAIKVTQTNYPRTNQLGDINNLKGLNLPKIDLLMAGSPCTSFSFAGKQDGFDGKSKLFYEVLRLLKETNPKYFLIENVRMKKQYENIISESLGVKPIYINSSLVSAQNRLRLYWANIPNVTIPEDRKIELKDIIDENYDGIWVWPRGTNKGGVKDYKNKSPTITISSWQHNFLIYKEIITGFGLRGRENEGKWTQIPTLNKNNKSNTITAQFRGKTDFVYDNGKVRKFTPEEAEKLQTIPAGYTNSIPKNQRFKCIGNGFTVDVIAHILSFLPK